MNGIQLLKTEAKSSVFQALLSGLATDLRSGESLGDSLAKYPKIVPEMSVRLIEAGEHSGNLEYAFEEAAIHLKKEITLKQQVKKALTYPGHSRCSGVNRHRHSGHGGSADYDRIVDQLWHRIAPESAA